MDFCNSDFGYTYQKLYFQDTGEPKKTVDVLRKCMVLSYSASLETFDNQNTSQVLTSKLNKLSAIIYAENGHIYQNKLNNLLQGRNISENQTNLNKIDVKSPITSLSCSNGNLMCCKSECPNEDNFKEFLSLYHQKRTKGILNEPSKHTFSKKFAPQTCNAKVNRLLRQTSDDSLGSEKPTLQSVPQIFETQLLNSKDAKESDKEVKSDQFGFKTAREELNAKSKKLCGGSAPNFGGQKRKLGARRGVGGKFISPMLSTCSDGVEENSKSEDWGDQPEDERLKNLEPKMVQLIKSEIMDCGPAIDWNDIAGLEFAKTSIQEAVVWPMLRPDIFTGLRRPPKGILLFGPPGTGKTLIGKCVASQSESTFFSISASSLTSKWIGDGEKMVRTLFAVARCYQPAVIFIDEIDSLLSQRSETEHESSRRIKTEFLVQLDGATTDSDERLLVIGATNRPQELDEAARRRFVKRLFIPLPELMARFQLITRLMSGEKHNLSQGDMMDIAHATDGYSGADMRNLCSDASLGPVRSIDMNLIQSIQTAEVRPVFMEDFKKALSRVKSSVAPSDLEQYIKWNKTYGSSHST